MLGITEVNHVGIRVSDKVRSIEFYSALGFELINDVGFESGHPVIMRHPSSVVLNLLGPADVRDGTNILMDVIQRGTGRKARVLEKALAGKTGTTNDFTDAWFVGFSPSLAAGVWVGFDDMRSLGNREAGARAALPIWISYMKTALEVPSRFQAIFPIPEDVVFALIDPKTGLLALDGVEDAHVEIFVKGTEPQNYAHLKPKPADFFRVDSSTN